ncbi:fimbrial protein [Citrobacter sp. FP75]|uniref:fimbrial protein n=1 Tax=Citrobacter sp. FP75 TaxID=1852949 RepID=UPI001BC93F52|nr:fimbrial protein [Citrobacter sp. FP75]
MRTGWVLACVGLLAFSGAQASGDNLRFHGSLVASACTVVANGGTLAEVTFPALSAGDLLLAPSAPQPFTLQLNDCDSALSNGVRVTFTGTEAAGLKGSLALDASSAAGGVAIGIRTLAGNAVAMNNTTGTTFTLASGNNQLTLNAVVQAIPPAGITSGAFSASATVNFEYL